MDMRGIRLREFSRAIPEAVFQADSYMPAHSRRHGRYRHLIPAGAENRPLVIVAEEPVGGSLHVQNILEMRPDPAANPEYGLDPERLLHQSPIQKVGEIV